MAILELVDRPEAEEKPEPEAKPGKKKAKAEAAKEE